MIGLLMVQLARLAGAARVALLEPVEGKREMGKRLGADICIDPVHEDVETALKKAGFTWINTVIECVGRPSTIEQAIEIAGSKAVVMMFGLTKPDETISVKPFEIFRKELELKASYINPCTQRRGAGPDRYRTPGCEGDGQRSMRSGTAEGCAEQSGTESKGKYIISPEK